MCTLSLLSNVDVYLAEKIMYRRCVTTANEQSDRFSEAREVHSVTYAKKVNIVRSLQRTYLNYQDSY